MLDRLDFPTFGYCSERLCTVIAMFRDPTPTLDTGCEWLACIFGYGFMVSRKD